MNKCWNCGAEGPTFRCQECGVRKDEPPTVTASPPQSVPGEQNHPNFAAVMPAHPLANVNPNYDVPVSVGALNSHLYDTEHHAVTNTGVDKLLNTDETMIWSGKPAPTFAAGLAIKWAIGILVSILLALLIGGGWFWVVFWMLCAAMHLGLYLAALSRMSYRITTQRVEVTDGLLHQQMRTYETHELGDATVDSPFLLGFLGLSILTVQHRYGTSGKLPLVRILHRIPENFAPTCLALPGLPTHEARVIRDLLRNTGQAEAQRWDKFRVR